MAMAKAKAPAEEVIEAGARNSKTDSAQIQAIHDSSTKLGAACSAKEAGPSAVEALPAPALALCEQACEFVESIQVREARSDYEVKLIAPGKGSTAFYSAEALAASGPKVFRAGTHMYWNHPTRSDESERPERSLNDLAAVLTRDAAYQEAGAKGPGLYARAKVFSDFAERIEDKAEHIGLSIMASGTAEMRDGKPVMREGVPVLKEFTAAQSTDFVTRAGAGGMILTESAGADAIQKREGSTAMDAAELKQLQESNASMLAQIRRLTERASLSDAAVEVRAVLGSLRISEAIAQRVTGRILAGVVPLTETGALDSAKLKLIVEAEAKDECSYIASLTGGRVVSGMGSAPEVTLTESERTANQKALDDEARGFAAGLGLRTTEAQDIMTRGRSAFHAEFNAGEVK